MAVIVANAVQQDARALFIRRTRQIGNFSNWKDHDSYQQAFQRRTAAEIERVSLFVATAEDTIISKLEWARMGASLRQIEDVVGILKVRKNNLDFFYIDKWVKQLELVEQWEAARKAAGLN